MSCYIIALDPLPRWVMTKACVEIDRIMNGGALKPKWKKMKKNSRLHRFKLTQKYRMVVEIGLLGKGPFLCMNHGTFDKRY